MKLITSFFLLLVSTFLMVYFTPVLAQSCGGAGTSCTSSDQCCALYECDTSGGQNSGVCRNLNTPGGCEQMKCNTKFQCAVFNYNPDPARGGCYKSNQCNTNTDCVPSPTPQTGSCSVYAPKTVLKGTTYEVVMQKNQPGGPLNCSQPTLAPNDACIVKTQFTDCSSGTNCKGIVKAKRAENCKINFKCTNVATQKNTSCAVTVKQTN